MYTCSVLNDSLVILLLQSRMRGSNMICHSQIKVFHSLISVNFPTMFD